MTDTKDQILRYLRTADEDGAHLHQIVRHLDTPRGDQHTVRRVLRELVRTGELQRGRGKTYSLSTQKPTFEGAFSLARDGYGFVAIAGQEGRDIFVPRDKTAGALDGDRVCVREEWASRGRRTGAVTQILQRNTVRVVGTLERTPHGDWIVTADNPHLDPIWIVPESVGGVEPGETVGVRITSYPEGRNARLEGDIECRFPREHTVRGLVDRVIFQAALRTDFPFEALAQARALPEEVLESEWQGQREDWRAIPLVTIDGEDARDFDDAVAWVPDHGYRRKQSAGTIYVAIADVAHYVAIDSPLDQEARRRGTSVYFPDRVIPMLPEELSNHLCSLRPLVDRLAVGTKIRLDEHGNVDSVSVHDVVIHSQARLTYTQVQRLLDKSEGEIPPKKLHPMLRALRVISDDLREKRIRGGSVDMELSEPKFILSEDQLQVESIESRTRTPATGLIEELMLLANREAALALENRGIPALYRIHEEPDDEKLRRFLVAAAHATGETRQPDRARPAEIQSLLDKCTDSAKRRVLYSLLLRAMQRARYSTDNAGHYGLGFQAYAHTTSPIRRYPDLVVQRMLKRYLMGKAVSRPPKTGGSLGNILAGIARECTESEERAQKADWDAQGMLQALYMQDRVGEDFDGVVGGITGNGIFVTIGNTGADGYLPVIALPPDDYQFNDRLVTLTGRRTRAMVSLGDSIRVTVAAANPTAGRIELALAADAAPLPKASAKGAGAKEYFGKGQDPSNREGTKREGTKRGRRK